MSSKFEGRVISAVAPPTSGTNYTGSASGMWGLISTAYAKRLNVWPKGVTGATAPVIGNLTISSVNNDVTIPFTPSVDLGAPTLETYVLTGPDGTNLTKTTSPFTTTLAPNVVYTFTIRGRNVAGDGEPGVSSTIMRLGTPTVGTPVFGNSQVSVPFTPNDANLSGLQTSYVVTSSPGNFTATGTSSPIVVPGLTNGTAYTFTVRASNDYGVSLTSSASTSMIPATVTSAPSIASVTAGVAQASVTITPPANNNGDAVSSYTVTSNPGNITATGSTSPVTITGLNVDLTYNFTVVANNKAGSSLPSAASNSIRPAFPPTAPNNIIADSGYSTSAVINFTPQSNGGYPATYTVTSSGGQTATGTSSPITVTGLTNGVTYNFNVRATNILGYNISSSSNNMIPGTPAAPTLTGVTYSLGTTASVSFNAPSLNGGSAVTGYTLIRSDGATVSGTSSPLVMANNFTDGVLYTFTVKATNANGTGPASNTSAQGTPKLTVNMTYSSPTANLTINDSVVSSAAYSAGWDGSAPIIVNITNNTTIYSTTVNSPAMTIQGITGSRTVRFTNNGYIIGMGGSGAPNSSSGAAGGVALFVQSYLSLNNAGIIAGGGGGGGGGGNWSQASWGSNGHSPGGSGGGGRSSNQSPSNGANATYWYGGLSVGGAGGQGTFSSGGSGGGGGYAYGVENWSNGNAGSPGGNSYGDGGAGSGGAGGIANRAIAGGGGGGGGGWGSAGGNGGNASQGYGGGGGGGAGGNAINGSVYITWIATGTRYGGVSSY